MNPDSREHRQALEDAARGKYCGKCGGPVNVAWVNQAYRHRCKCFPEQPVLTKPESAIARYLRTGEGDTVTQMQAERIKLKRRKK